MSLDFKLIEKSTRHAINILDLSEIVCPGLLHVSELLDPVLLVKLQDYIFNNKLVWERQEDPIALSRYFGRKKINWVPDSVIEETHMVLDGLTDYVNQRFNKQNKFGGLSIWKDEHTYQVPLHTDDLRIDISMQIYLNGDNNMDLGTGFRLDTVVKIPYKTNHGYLMDNRQKIPHFYNGKSPKDYYRYSLYAIWTNANK
jgi:hypothetical protein